MNYEEMSDFEINKAVAGIIYPQLKLLDHNDGRSVFVSKSEDKLDFMAIKNSNFNPCSDPSDAWPIIVESEMKIDPRRSSPKLDWMVSRDDQIYAVDKNPLRAAMICFLKMKDA